MTTHDINKDPLRVIPSNTTPLTQEQIFQLSKQYQPGDVIACKTLAEAKAVADAFAQQHKPKPAYDALMIRRQPISGYTVHRPSGDTIAAFGNLFDAVAFLNRSM